MRYASRQITYYCVHFNIVTNANDMRNEKSFSCQPINDRNSRRRHTTHPVPPLGELDEKYSSFMILAYSSHYYENLTLSTKPEVHNVCTARPQTTCTENSVKCGRISRYASKHTDKETDRDKQTNRQTCRHADRNSSLRHFADAVTLFALLYCSS